jgi:hypothetical protein
MTDWRSRSGVALAAMGGADGRDADRKRGEGESREPVGGGVGQRLAEAGHWFFKTQAKRRGGLRESCVTCVAPGLVGASASLRNRSDV